MATKKGLVKKTLLKEFRHIRANGIIAIRLDADDDLIGVRVSDGEQEIMLSSSGGRAIRFSETEVRPTGRATRGVTGMRLREGDRVIAMTLVAERASLLAISENGYGKRTRLEEYHRQGAGRPGCVHPQDRRSQRRHGGGLAGGG
jgi:Type IIA topoisomerase (DNA gyrase/topo II, topoisomerase IV), A subunit